MKQSLFIFFLGLSFALPAQTMIKARSGEVEYNVEPPKTDTTAKPIGAERFALIIGNKSYPTAPLENPVNDANDLSSALKRKNFQVTTLIDATHLEMLNAIREFTARISKGGVGLFYYSGHGVQVEGENYLVPVDARYEYKEEVPDYCVNVNIILRFMENTNNQLNILILDACRNSPFKSFSRSGEKGMVRIEPPTGSIVAFSTAPGRTASDGTGRNGLYTSKLMKYLNVPGMKIEDIFKQVRIEVTKESNGKQQPWENSALMGDFYFTEN